jgi:hypothetical protein
VRGSGGWFRPAQKAYGRTGTKICIVRNFGDSPPGAFAEIAFGFSLESPRNSADQELLVGGPGILAKEFAELDFQSGYVKMT